MEERDDLILYKKDGAIARITFNIPEKHNALDIMGNGPDAQQMKLVVENLTDADMIDLAAYLGTIQR